jgi:uncharacterized membrane protein
MAGVAITLPGAAGSLAAVGAVEVAAAEEAGFPAGAAVSAEVAREEVGEVGRQIMTAGKFLKQLHHDEIVAAIREAEKRTSGEVRVFISRKLVANPVEAAQAHFVQLRMEKTRDRNGVLIFVAPRARRFAVVGDAGVHERCGEGFWKELADEMSGHFAKSEFTSGIVHGVKKAGELLARHFPHRPDDANELPDDVAHD